MFAPFPLEFYLHYKVSTEIQGPSSTDRNFQGLLRPFKALNFYFKIQGFLRTFKVCANPGICIWILGLKGLTLTFFAA